MITSLLMKEGHVIPDISCDHWENLVDLLATPLVNKGLISPQYTQSAKEVIHKYGAYVVLVDDIAFFHGRPEDGAVEMSMSLGFLKEPLYLMQKRIKTAFLFAAIDNDSHIALLKELTLFMNCDECLELLRDGKNVELIMEKLREKEELNEVS